MQLSLRNESAASVFVNEQWLRFFIEILLSHLFLYTLMFVVSLESFDLASETNYDLTKLGLVLQNICHDYIAGLSSVNILCA